MLPTYVPPKLAEHGNNESRCSSCSVDSNSTKSTDRDSARLVFLTHLPPKLAEHREEQRPVVRVPLNPVGYAAVHGPHVKVGPLPVEDLQKTCTASVYLGSIRIRDGLVLL
jgi:hypothetical protein